jgi:hypothetical protein
MRWITTRWYLICALVAFDVTDATEGTDLIDVSGVDEDLHMNRRFLRFGHYLFEKTPKWTCSLAPFWTGNVQRIRNCGHECGMAGACHSFEYMNPQTSGECRLFNSSDAVDSKFLKQRCSSGQASSGDHYTILNAARISIKPQSVFKTTAGQRWEVTKRFDCYGGNLYNYMVQSSDEKRGQQHAECAKACNKDPACVGFNFPRSGNWSEFFSRQPGMLPEDWGELYQQSIAQCDVQ